MAATDNPYPTEIPYKFLYWVMGTQIALEIKVNAITPNGPPSNVLVNQVVMGVIGMSDIMNAAGKAALDGLVLVLSVATDVGWSCSTSLPPRMVNKRDERVVSCRNGWAGFDFDITANASTFCGTLDTARIMEIPTIEA